MEDNNNSISIMKYIKPLTFGLLFGTITIIILFLLFAFVIVKFKISASMISLIVILCAAAGAFVGGIISSKIFGKKGLVIGLINGLFFAIILILVSAVFSHSILSGENITKYIIMIISSMIGGIIGVNLRKSRR